jgi:3-phenylpropionate/trans-cinnamate dioxygenase ferredoxin component
LDFVRIASLVEVPDGELRAFETDLGRVAVAHLANRLFVISDTCTHQGCSLAEGELSDEDLAVECPCHGSVFDLTSGEPIEGPATDPVAVFSVQETDGWIEIASQEAR